MRYLNFSLMKQQPLENKHELQLPVVMQNYRSASCQQTKIRIPLVCYQVIRAETHIKKDLSGLLRVVREHSHLINCIRMYEKNWMKTFLMRLRLSHTKDY